MPHSDIHPEKSQIFATSLTGHAPAATTVYEAASDAYDAVSGAASDVADAIGDAWDDWSPFRRKLLAQQPPDAGLPFTVQWAASTGGIFGQQATCVSVL